MTESEEKVCELEGEIASRDREITALRNNIREIARLLDEREQYRAGRFIANLLEGFSRDGY